MHSTLISVYPYIDTPVKRVSLPLCIDDFVTYQGKPHVVYDVVKDLDADVAIAFIREYGSITEAEKKIVVNVSGKAKIKTGDTTKIVEVEPIEAEVIELAEEEPNPMKAETAIIV